VEERGGCNWRREGGGGGWVGWKEGYTADLCRNYKRKGWSVCNEDVGTRRMEGISRMEGTRRMEGKIKYSRGTREMVRLKNRGDYKERGTRRMEGTTVVG
jgi:hypothetical protein